MNKYSWDNLKSEFNKLFDVEQEEKHLKPDINISKETEHSDIDRKDTLTQPKTWIVNLFSYGNLWILKAEYRLSRW